MSFDGAANNAVSRYARDDEGRKARQALQPSFEDIEDGIVSADSRGFSRYLVNVKGKEYIDIYEILDLYKVTRHAVGHAIKKLLVAGRRGTKDYETDLNEAIAAVQRELELTKQSRVSKGAKVPTPPL